jgi:protocatechuate 3,4-dioxygenase beta subunit
VNTLAPYSELISRSCAPITDALIYTWDCDKDGVYSGYSQPGGNTIGDTFCRGVQMTDNSGLVRFTTIHPGWYSDRYAARGQKTSVTSFRTP